MSEPEVLMKLARMTSLPLEDVGEQCHIWLQVPWLPEPEDIACWVALIWYHSEPGWLREKAVEAEMGLPWLFCVAVRRGSKIALMRTT